jgi:CubicO group peptidase (beta-lactamase class C family)
MCGFIGGKPSFVHKIRFHMTLFIPFFTAARNTCLWAMLLLMTLAIPARAQNDISRTVDKIIGKAMTDEAIPGVAVAIIRDGNILFEKGYGVRSVNKAAATDEQTVFSIGSVSKAFTAVGLMLLVQENKLVLDDPIKKYMKGLPTGWQNITIRQFMTHTSGIPELKGDKDNGSFEQTLFQAGKMKMAFNPGARQQYNNFNFAVMGKLIEAITGMDYISFMQKRVFKPAGMVSSGVKPASNDMSTGHLGKKGKLVPVETHFNAGDYGVPSGGLQTTLTDFVQLSQALYKRQLIRKNMLETMWTPYSSTLSNTPGWHSRTAGSELIIHKGGGGTGIGSVCDYKIVPSRNLYVMVMFNKARNKISPADVTDDILLQCFNIPKTPKGGNDGEGNEK